MNPALILPIIQAILAAAPTIAVGIDKAKDLITALFTAKLIDDVQQNALFAHVDALGALVAAGITPPHWTVEPDPVE